MVRAIRLVCRASSFRSPYLVHLVALKCTPVPSIQSIQITAPQGSNLNTVELSVGAEIAAQSSIVQTDEHVATVAIPSDVGDLSQSAQLDVSIAGAGFPVDAEGNSGIDFEFNISPGQTPQNVADQLLNEIQTRLGGAAQETVDVRIETGEGGELSLVLQSSAGPITAGINFESSIQGQSGTQQINTVELPDQLDPGETLELTLTVNTPTGTQTVTLSQTLAGDETLQDAAEGLVEDLAELTDGQGNPLGLSGELVQVTIPGSPGGTEGTPVPSIQSIQITAPQGSNLNTVELSVGAEIAAQSSIVQTDEHVATVAIPSDVGDLSQSAQLDVSIAGADFPVDAEGNSGIDFEFNISPGQTPQNVADQLLNEIQTRLGGAAQRRWMSGLRPARVVSCRSCAAVERGASDQHGEGADNFE